MNSNVTTILLLGVLGLVAYKLLSKPASTPLLGIAASQPSYSPTSQNAPAGQKGGTSDFAAAVGAFASVFSTIGDIYSSTTPQDN